MKAFYLLIEYTNGTEKALCFDTYKEAYQFVMNEGDHVEDWTINGY